MMPEMDGIETLKKVKEENLAPDTCFIALTANAIHGARQAYLDAGFDDYLSKPFTGTDTPKEEAPAENEQLTEIAAEKAKEYFNAIKEACLAYDDDEAERLCGEITGCSVNGEPLKPVLDEILASAEDFEYEAAAAAAEKFAEKL